MNRTSTLNYLKRRETKIPFFKSLYSKELSLLFIVGIIGCIGTLFIFNKAWISNGSNAPQQNLNTITIAKCDKSQSKSIRNDNIVDISGNLYANDPVTFTVNNYNSKAQYLISFGDGTEKLLSGDFYIHQFAEPGNYPVKMKMLYKENTSEIFETSLKINQASGSFINELSLN